MDLETRGPLLFFLFHLASGSCMVGWLKAMYSGEIKGWREFPSSGNPWLNARKQNVFTLLNEHNEAHN